MSSQILQDKELLLDFFELDWMAKYGLILIYNHYFQKKSEQKIEKILLVTSHPDDEAMFFYPLIEELRHQYEIILFCFSNGNADGLGKVREKELEKCCEFLGIKKLEILNQKETQDGFDQQWPKEFIASQLHKFMQKEEGIKGIITFDDYGISGHPNHIAVHYGVMHYLQEYVQRDNQLKVYTLKTVNFMRKYIGVADFFLSFYENHIYLNFNMIKRYQSMKIHHSQFVWYRKLFVFFSRYSYINTLQKIR